MRTKQYFIGFLVLVAVIAGGVSVSRSTNTVSATPTPLVSASATPLSSAMVTGVSGQSALSTLKANYKVETKEYTGLGEYVYAINGNASTDKKYWSFYIDGKMADVGAGAYIAKGGEKIEFRYEGL